MNTNETPTANAANGTDSSPITAPQYFSTAFTAIIITVQIIVIAVAIAGNMLVCFAIAVHERLRSSTTNYFIFSLAVSDIMTASLPMPLDVEMMLKNYHWTHGEFLCDFWALTYLIAAPASILNLLAVTVVRYRAISRPLQYSLLVTPQRALGVIACVWLYTILFAVIGLTQWPYNQQSIMDGLCIFNVKPLFSNTINIVNFMLPTLIVCVLYFKIYQIAQAHARRICRFEIYSESTNDGTSITAERKAIYSNIQAAKTIAIIVFTFLTCWMPYNLLSLIKGFWYDLNIPYEVQPILILLAYTNSAMNPFVYAYRNREFRESFRRLFKLQTTWV